MRPVERGPAPRTYASYQDAADDLQKRLDVYCSYCERRIPVNLAVEHVSPKSLDEDRKTDWTNFLLGCTNCNSVKLDQATDNRRFLWPDQDNTLRAFQYTTGGFVSLAKGLPRGIPPKAARLMDIVGLDRHPGNPNSRKPAPKDRRWEQREEAFRAAQRCRELVMQIGTDGAREQATIAAKYCGFFSVWMTVFENDVTMRRMLIREFLGNAKDCYDDTTASVRRPNGKL